MLEINLSVWRPSFGMSKRPSVLRITAKRASRISGRNHILETQEGIPK